MSLQENDRIFKLHALSVDTIKKRKFLINYIIIKKKRNGYCSQKNALLYILSLTNQFHRSRSTYSKKSKCGKIYFLENWISNIIKRWQNKLSRAVETYKKAVKKNLVNIKRTLIPNNKSKNKAVDEFFR